MAGRYEPLTTLLRAVGDALAPLAAQLGSAGGVQDVLAEQGLLVDVVPTSIESTAAALGALGSELTRFADAVGGDVGTVIERSIALGAAIAAASSALAALPAGLQAELTALADQLAAIDVAELGARVFEGQLIGHLRATLPPLVHALAVAGLVDGVGGLATPATGVLVPAEAEATAPVVESAASTLDLLAPRIHWARFARLVQEPHALFEEVYGWGSASYTGGRLLARIHDLLRALGLPARLGDGRPAMPASIEVGEALSAPLFQAAGGPVAVEAGVTAAVVLPSAAETDGGLALGVYVDGDAGVSLALSDDVTLTVEASAALGSGLVLVVRPPFAIEAIADPAGAATAASADLRLLFRWAPAGGFTPLDATGLATLTIDALELGVGVVVADGEAAGQVSLAVVGGTLAIGSGDGDSFLKEVLGDGSQAHFDLGVSWSPATGVRFDGAAALSVQIVLNAALGPMRLDWLTVALAVDGSGADLTLRATGGLELGPFTVSVDGVGAGIALTAAGDGHGNLGPFDLAAPRFVPPHGLGLALDLGELGSGGGYLDLDSDGGTYAGVAQLELLGVGITAIGVLATRMPDGSDGWSMFLALSATFTGLQLGFGFTLSGIGGLIGVNRGIDLDALSDGVRSGALEGLLFPADPIGDAPRILADLDAIFPPARGQYVFGPLAKIGWGTPNLATVDLGIVIQLPDPITISLLGSFEAVLPTEDVAVLELRIDVAGTLDLTNGTIAVDASLRDSKVAGLTLTGDMAMRAAFLDQPSFLLSFGGFNPRFVPPADFPSLDRLAVRLDSTDELRIECSGYFAITSNTVQFGAACSLWAKAVGLTVEGGFHFDALIQFAPFAFVIDLGFDVSVRAGKTELFGVHLALMFEGPNPWHALGTATVKILGFKKDFRVEATLGRREAEGTREVIDVRQLVIAALRDATAWREVSPVEQVVVLGEGATDDPAVRVHPAGGVEVRQRVVPLDRTLETFGNAAIGGTDRFALTGATLGGDPATTTSIDDWFAAASFFEMSDAEKLAAPSFEPMPCGLRLGEDGFDAGPAAELELGYEQIVRDPDLAEAERAVAVVYRPTSASLAVAVARSPVARSRRSAGLARPPSAFTLAQPSYVVADIATGAVDRSRTPRATSWSQAREQLDGDGAHHIVPAHEIEDAA